MKRRYPVRPAASLAKGPPEALGQSESFLEFQQRLSAVAKVDRPVLILGERGTGKELVASRLHYLSTRWEHPLIALNCAALAPSLLEAELFGHVPGAFTGAAQQRAGRFEAAHGGTLFLDEIGLIPVEVQEKILRVVEYGTFERVGSSEPITVDARIVGATNADLPSLVTDGKFKIDLLDRLSFEVLTLPPLRERAGDILFLAEHFAQRMAFELGWEKSPEFSDEATATLEQYHWPGNVRELKNVVERAVYRSGGERIRVIDFNPFRSSLSPVRPGAPARKQGADPVAAAETPFLLGEKDLKAAVRRLEVGALKEALQRTRYHQGAAARLLGLSYHQFRALYRKHAERLQAANP